MTRGRGLFVMAPLLAALLGSGLVGQEATLSKVAAGVQDPIASLVPADATGLLRVSSVGGLEKKLRKMVSAVDPDSADFIDVQELMAMIDMELDIDMSKPAAVAFVLAPDPQDDPTFVAILPFNDAKQAAEDLDAEGFDSEPIVRGNYVAFCPSGDFKPGNGTSRLVKELPEMDMLLRLDLGTMISAFREEIDEGMEMMFDEMRRETEREPGAAAIINPMIGFMRDAVDSADLMDFGLRIEGMTADLEGALTVKQGSPLGKAKLFESNNRLSELARCLPESHPISALMAIDMGSIMDMIGPMMKELEQQIPEEQRGTFAKLMDANTELVKHMDNNVAFSMGAGEDGIQVVEIFGAKDSKALLDTFLGFFKNDAFGDMGIMWRMSDKKEVDGVEVHSGLMNLDFEKMSQWVGEPAPPEMQEMVNGMMQKLFRAEGMPVAMAAVGDLAVFTLGSGKGLIENAIAAARNGKQAPHPGLVRAMKKAGTRPGMVMQADAREVMKQVSALVRALDMGIPMPAVPDGPPAEVLVYAGANGLTLRGGVSVQVDQLATLIKGLRGR